jgi:hypothetical protein
MNKYNVYIDLDSFTWRVEACDEDTARKLAVVAMQKYLEEYSQDIEIADVIVDEDSTLDDSDIELREVVA